MDFWYKTPININYAYFSLETFIERNLTED